MSNLPVLKKRDRNLSVAVFESQYRTDSGETRTRFSISVQRSYKKDDKWEQQSINCFVDELLPLSSLLENTYVKLNEYIEKRTQNGGSRGSAAAQSTDCDDDIPF